MNLKQLQKNIIILLISFIFFCFVNFKIDNFLFFKIKQKMYVSLYLSPLKYFPVFIYFLIYNLLYNLIKTLNGFGDRLSDIELYHWNFNWEADINSIFTKPV